MPFTNREKDNINTTERNKQLIAQAKKSGIDYVITGELINAESKQDDKKQYVGSVKYELYVLTVENGQMINQLISDKDEPKNRKRKRKGWDC